MGASRVKVSKKRSIPAGVRLDMVLDNYRAELVRMSQTSGRGAAEPVYGEHKHTHLNHHLGSSVRVSGTNGASLWDGDHVWMSRSVTINGGRRRKHNVLHAIRFHGAEERDSSSDIDTVVFNRDLGRLSNRLAVLPVSRAPRIVNDCGVESSRMHDLEQATRARGSQTFKAAK